MTSYNRTILPKSFSFFTDIYKLQRMGPILVYYTEILDLVTIALNKHCLGLTIFNQYSIAVTEQTVCH